MAGKKHSDCFTPDESVVMAEILEKVRRQVLGA